MKFFTILILSFLGISKSMFGWDYYGAQQHLGCFEVAAEFLYFLPSIDQPEYAQEVDPNSPATVIIEGDRVSNSPEWKPGYRIDLAYFFCNETHLRGRFTHLPNIQYSDSTDQNVSGILNHPAQTIDDASGASISDKFDFLYAELLFGGNELCFGCSELGFELGVQYAYIKWQENVIYNNFNLDKITNTFKFHGVGPEFVLNFKHHFFNRLSLAGRNAFALLINKRDTDYLDRLTVPFLLRVRAKNEEYWYGTPTVDLRLGLNYTPCYCNLHFDIEIGYEIIHFWKAVDRIFYTNLAQIGTSLTEHQDFTLHGPYGRLGIFF